MKKVMVGGFGHHPQAAYACRPTHWQTCKKERGQREREKGKKSLRPVFVNFFFFLAFVLIKAALIQG